MYKLTNTENNRIVELTEEEINTIYDALGDYQDTGEEEEVFCDTIRDKLSKVS